MSAARRALLVVAGAVAARAALSIGRAATRQGDRQRRDLRQEPALGHRRVPGIRQAPGPSPTWARTNFHGETVNLVAGPAVAVAASATAAVGAPHPASGAAAFIAGAGSGAVGLYDDLVGGRPEHRAKGFHGHLAALRQGRITSGAVKILGVGAAGLSAAALLEVTAGRRRSGPARALNITLGAGLIAGAANLLNLLDLRPGRALKVSLLTGAPLLVGPAGGLIAGPAGAAAAALPEDLAEQTMLGDCGANALGALLGTALATRTGPAGRAVALAGIAALTATSERVSFTRVIADTPALRWLDELGRRGD